MLSVTTDYRTDHGCPGPYLERIARAGFSHVHWCHQWCTDFLYSEPEIARIEEWLREYGLKLLDLHGSHGVEKGWGSALEYERASGVELIANRLEMTARLGGDAVVMHLPGCDGAPDESYWERVFRSLDALRPLAEASGVRIALENGGSHASFDAIEHVFGSYDGAYVGLCYDSGHGNLFPEGLDRLNAVKERLIAVHLHDNDGQGDQHKPLFTGTIDWERLAGVLASSAYDKCVSMEISMRNAGTDDEEAFLADAFATGSRLADMVAAARI